MVRRRSTQWDFGDLFSQEEEKKDRRILTVSELTTQVKALLEDQIGVVWVNGEITNLRFQNSGHIYFTLKDAGSQIACVLFRGERVRYRDLLEDGQKLLLQGDLTVYEPRGQYQLIVRSIELQGQGALQIAFERLKQKLKAEGLFETARKRELPPYPQRIGLVTSSTGAAIRDILHVIRRRNPSLELFLVPVRVQGQGAGEEIAEAIRWLNEWSLARKESSRLDVILVTRGGGSLEDLWAFNEEVVARAIAASKVPIMSAVGHEIDFTISDFVADVRAATPSSAAEILTAGVVQRREELAELARWLPRRMRQRLQVEGQELAHLQHRLHRTHPRRRWNEQLQRLDDLQWSLSNLLGQRWREARMHWMHLSQRFVRCRPHVQLDRRKGELQHLQVRLLDRIYRQHEKQKVRLEQLETRLRLLSPEQVLARGYSITREESTGRILRRANEVREGATVRTRLHSGELRSKVITEKNPNDPASEEH